MSTTNTTTTMSYSTTMTMSTQKPKTPPKPSTCTTTTSSTQPISAWFQSASNKETELDEDTSTTESQKERDVDDIRIMRHDERYENEMHKFLNSTRAKRKRENSGITESYSKLTERELHEKTIEMHMDLAAMNMQTFSSLRNIEETLNTGNIIPRLDDLEQRMEVKDSEIEMLKSRVHHLEMEARSRNVMIHNLPETEDRNLNTHVSSILGKIGTYTIDTVQRLGKYQGKDSNPRPILVKMATTTARNHILRNSSAIKSAKFLGEKVFITDHVSQETLEQQRNLQQVMHKIRNNGGYAIIPLTVPREIKYSLGPKPTCEADKKPLQTYTYEDFKSGKNPLGSHEPLEAMVQNDKSQPLEVENNLIFLGKEMILSNWHICQFKIGDQTFNSVEQYLGYDMAQSAGDDDSSKSIMEESDPRLIKRMFNTIKWSKMYKYDYDMTRSMYDAQLAKFSQNSHLKDYLLGTTGYNLIEGTRDRVWGMGLSLNIDRKSIMNKSQWPTNAQNKCGRSLENVRSNLI